MQAIVTGIQFVLGKIVAFARFLVDVVLQVFVDMWEFMTDLPVWVFDQTLGLVETALSAINVTVISNNLSAWGSIPSNVLEVTSALGVGNCAAVISAAILIRLTLQLIPFTRLGS